MILVPIESAYATSYILVISVLTLVLFFAPFLRHCRCGDNLCDHGIWTSLMDRQTNRQTDRILLFADIAYDPANDGCHVKYQLASRSIPRGLCTEHTAKI